MESARAGLHTEFQAPSEFRTNNKYSDRGREGARGGEETEKKGGGGKNRWRGIIELEGVVNVTFSCMHVVNER